MDALLNAIVAWLAINFGLSSTAEMPAVRFAPPLEIAFLHYEAFTEETQRRVIAMYAAAPANDRREVVSVYDERRRTIVLRQDWTGKTPAELSEVVHEMVHHLQAAEGLHYACPEQREKLAYEAQEKWLGMFKTNLEREFDIDALTLLATTNCGF